MSATGESLNDLTLSTIIRFHTRERLQLLEEAIASLAAQEWRELEAVVVLQNPDEALPREVEQVIRRKPWSSAPQFQIVAVKVPAGVDGRAELLNRGLARAAGRFIAFLDDDDLVYPNGYATLIRQLLRGGRAVAVGGYRKAYLRREAGRWHVSGRKEAAVGEPSRLTLFRYSYIPIHSYVIDRSRLGGLELYFDAGVVPAEDYDFLLRLFAASVPDFSCFHTPVCEYRIHELNSIGASLDRPDEQPPALRRALALVDEKKQTLPSVVTVAELAAMAEELARLSAERERAAYRLARRAHAAVDRRPRLRSWLRALTGRQGE